MAFPQTPLPVRVALFYDDAWHRIPTGDPRHATGVTITRGQRDEQSRVTPARCSATLESGVAGTYSPRNPNSPLFGKIGRNTPIRPSVLVVEDTFTRSASSSWGSADTGQAWTTVSGSASDFSVNGTKGLHSAGTRNVIRFTRVDSAHADVSVAASIATDKLAVTAPLRAGVVARRLDSSNYYLADLEFNTSGAIDLQLWKVVAGVATQLGTDFATGLTHVANTEYRVRLDVYGSTVRAHAWLASAGEPDTWSLSVTDTALTAAGQVGCRSLIDTTNTTTLPVAFSFDNFEDENIRFSGEVSAWPPKWDTTGTDVTVAIEASGVLRRLTQGAKPLRSQMRRGLPRTADIVAYWPMEEGSGATQFAEYLGRTPLRFTGHRDTIAPGSAEYPGLGGSAPLAVISTDAQFSGGVVAHTATSWAVQFVAYIPAAVSSNTVLLQWTTSGNPYFWRVKLGSGTPNSIALQAFNDPAGAAVVDNVTSFIDLSDGSSAIGRWVLIVAEARQDGADIDYSIVWDFSEGAGSTGLEGTTASKTIGAVTAIGFPLAPAILDGYSIGHIRVRSVSGGFFTPIDSQYMGTQGEPAGTRLTSLCAENDVPFELVGTAADTVEVAPQRIATLPDLLNDAADADAGILYEPRRTLGLAYRTVKALTNQAPALELDYARPTAHLGAGDGLSGIELTEDDQTIRNDVTVARQGGSSERYVQETGPLNTQDPKGDPTGVGVYDEQLTLYLASDSQLADAARWRVHVGTVDEARFPALAVELARAVFVADLATAAEAAAVDIGDLLTVDNPPAWLPPDLIQVVVRGITERFGGFGWSISWNTSPARPYETWTIEGGANTGRLKSDGSTLAEDLDTTETAIDVATPSGPLWITTGDDFDIEIGGERMTCTSISGAASPQTFTVTRSVNGIVKTHATGAAVNLWRQSALALI